MRNNLKKYIALTLALLLALSALAACRKPDPAPESTPSESKTGTGSGLLSSGSSIFGIQTFWGGIAQYIADDGTVSIPLTGDGLSYMRVEYSLPDNPADYRYYWIGLESGAASLPAGSWLRVQFLTRGEQYRQCLKDLDQNENKEGLILVRIWIEVWDENEGGTPAVLDRYGSNLDFLMQIGYKDVSGVTGINEGQDEALFMKHKVAPAGTPFSQYIVFTATHPFEAFAIISE